ncbi:MAG: macro domain-containing protein, partial [Pseudomonas sp.]|nr:macro domain-containing protein [Pseudomonas sp.]
MPFKIERNDLAAVDSDAIVIAANERLQITGGVGLAVALAAGLEELQAACDEIGFCPCGSAVATPAFGLNAKTIVHAVGPVWQGGGLGEADFLRSTYDASLECAASEGARSIALPLISAGTYGFPADV